MVFRAPNQTIASNMVAAAEQPDGGGGGSETSHGSSPQRTPYPPPGGYPYPYGPYGGQPPPPQYYPYPGYPPPPPQYYYSFTECDGRKSFFFTECDGKEDAVSCSRKRKADWDLQRTTHPPACRPPAANQDPSVSRFDVLLRATEIHEILNAASNLRDDEAFFKTLLEMEGSRGEVLRYASARLSDAHGVPGRAIQYASDRLKNNKELVLSAVSKDGTNLEYASENLQNDRDVVKAAILQNGYALQFASADLQNDREIMAAALPTYALALRFASDEFSSDLVPPPLRDNEYFFQSLFEKHGVPGSAIQFASDRLRSKKELVISAFSTDWSGLRYVAEHLKNDEDVVRAVRAAKTSVMPPMLRSFRHASETFNILKNVRDVVKAAVLQNGKALQFASADLRNDREIVTSAVGTHAFALRFASDELRSDKDLVLGAVQRGNFSVLKWSAPRLRDDEYFFKSLFEEHGVPGRAIQYASERLRSKKELVISAVSKDGISLKHVAEHLKNDEDVVRAAKTSALAALRHDGNLLKSAPECFRMDEDCVLAAISSKPGALRFALGGLNQDPKCLIKAGLWDAEYGTHRQERKIVLSTRFSLAAESSPTATDFTVLLKKHPYFQNSTRAFKVYSPNAFNKQTCDPNWTDMEWKCRGTKETCQMEDRSLCEGPARSECCWRYSYRCHLAEAKASHGFMIQVVEFDVNSRRFKMGKGQAIERVMAEEVGTKVFVVYEPCHSAIFQPGFRAEEIDRLADHVKEWYANGCEEIGIERVPATCSSFMKLSERR